MSNTVRVTGFVPADYRPVVNGMTSGTPEWPQIWVGTPTCAEEAGRHWSCCVEAAPEPGTYTRWSEGGQIWYSSADFMGTVEVGMVPHAAIQVAGAQATGYETREEES